MVVAEVSFYEVVKFFHITALVVGVGPTFAYGAFLAVATRESGAALATVGRAVTLWNRTANTLALAIILLSGLYLVSDGPWSFSDFFVSWGFVAIIFLFGVTHGYFIPKTQALVEAADRGQPGPGGEPGTEVDEINRDLAKWGSVVGIVIVLTIYVMTAKPFI